MSKDLQIYFVLSAKYEDELSTNEEMQQAFELCRQNQIIPEWISEANCLTTNFSKTDVVVFEKFEGEAYQKVKTRLSVAGPWCIITCLLEGLQVPSNKSPIYNMAMHKLTVTASNYTADQKKSLKEKIEMMGGAFSLHVTSNVTHLVTNSVRTQKYAVANEKGIAVMLESWVEDVWNCSLTRNVKATDEEFAKHKCPCFQNLRICSTGFETSERNKLQKLITTHGGSYTGKMGTKVTDLLLCKPGIKSEKYDVAKKAKIPCVRIEWIYDSVEKGFAVPDEEYVIKVASSTPTKCDAPLNPDFSMMSVISGVENNDIFKTSVSDTVNASLLSIATPTSYRRTIAQKENQEPDLVAEIDLQAVRKAGTFLDGCGVLLAGFSPERRDKLCRILRSAGATRYDAISDRVTQVLVGDPASHEVRLLGTRAPLVSASWLMESMRSGQPVPEEPYIIQIGTQVVNTPAPSSPLSKKGLTLLQNDTSMVADPEHLRQPEPDPELEEHESIKLYKTKKTTEEDTLAQLLAGAENINSNFHTNAENESNETGEAEEQETWYALFDKKTFKLIDHTDEETEKLTAVIEDLGGKVVGNNYRGVTDYAVVPPVSGAIRHAAAEVVSNLWLLDCHMNSELLTPLYYHHPMSIASNAQPLQDCVITISGYSGHERTFLIRLIQELGAKYQDKFARITVADRSVQASTHLVCLEATGDKWAAAQKWQRHAVTHEWLLRCAETGQWVPEKDFLRLKSDQISGIQKINNNQTAAGSTTPANKYGKNERNLTTENKKIINDKNLTDAAPATPSFIANRQDFGSRRISPPKNKKTSPAKNNMDDPITPVPIRNKRDFEGKRKSPESPPQTDTITRKISPSAASTSCAKNKQAPVETPTDNNINAQAHNDQNVGENPMLVLDDGSRVPLSTYMAELREQGVYDTPSPVRQAPPGTPIQEILSRLRREGKLPTSQGVVTPTRSGSDPGIGSQGTPVGRYLRGLQERNVLPASPKQTGTAADDSPVPRSVFDVKTPETPLGRFLGEDDPSRSTRKHWQRYLDRIPDYPRIASPAAPPRRLSTPWSEVKRQAWSWLIRDKDNSESESPSKVEDTSSNEVTPSQREVSNQIGQIQDMLKRRESIGPSRSLLVLDGQGPSTSSDAGTSEAKDSQTDTVGWDEPMEDCVFSEITGPRKFMMSSIDAAERSKCCNIIRSLGGEVSEYNFFDKTATHVVVSNPTRNEKILSSMAAGLWILHYSYLEQSAAAGRFLPEDDYAIGNPKSKITSLIKSSSVADSLYWWHENFCQTGKGAFHGIRAIVFAKSEEAIVRLIEAGGGTIIQASPPFAHSLDITHCFIDLKLKLDYNEFIPLAQQGIPCLNILYLSSYLSQRTEVNINEYIIAALRDYYN